MELIVKGASVVQLQQLQISHRIVLSAIEMLEYVILPIKEQNYRIRLIRHHVSRSAEWNGSHYSNSSSNSSGVTPSILEAHQHVNMPCNLILKAEVQEM